MKDIVSKINEYKEDNSSLNNPTPKPLPFTRVPQQRALSARQRFEQNQKMQVLQTILYHKLQVQERQLSTAMQS